MRESMLPGRGGGAGRRVRGSASRGSERLELGEWQRQLPDWRWPDQHWDLQRATLSSSSSDLVCAANPARKSSARSKQRQLDSFLRGAITRGRTGSRRRAIISAIRLWPPRWGSGDAWPAGALVTSWARGDLPRPRGERRGPRPCGRWRCRWPRARGPRPRMAMGGSPAPACVVCV